MLIVPVFMKKIVSSSLYGCARRSFSSVIQPTKKRKIDIIAHRGASGYFPDHTMLSYECAFADGADWIELDCHSTKDGILCINHDVELSETTNCAKLFPERRRKVHAPAQDGDAVDLDGWVISDFTIDEIKRLRVSMRNMRRNQLNDEICGVPTVLEVCNRLDELHQQFNKDKLSSSVSQHNGSVGLYIETKRPAWYRSIGLPLEENLIEDIDN